MSAAEQMPIVWERDHWLYRCGMPDRSGLAAYTHLIRSAHDGARETREVRHARIGVAAGVIEWRKLEQGNVDEWASAIEALMRDGQPRTFNGIVLELTDAKCTADTAFGKDPDDALWKLVEARTLWWSCDIDCDATFFIHADFIQQETA